MSQENVKIVRAGFAAYNAGQMDALRELLNPDAIIVRGLEGWPEPGPFVGRDAVIRSFERLREAWNKDTLEPTRLIDAGDRVVARQTWRAVGSGPDMNMDMTVIFTLRGGKIFLMEYYWDHTEALKAVGLSEQDAHADS